MLAEERLSRIMKLLSQQRTATVQELCEALDASESTIRRDLNELDRMGKVNKVHGGATLPDSQFLADEPTMAAKEALAVVQKKCIAKAAAALITAEDFVFLDAGSTTLALVRELSGPALDASPTASLTPVCWPRRAARSFWWAVCCGPRRRPSSALRLSTACSSTTSRKRSWGQTAWRWTQDSRLLTPRKRLSRPRSCAGREKPGSSWMTRSSPKSTPPSSPTCTAVPS